MKFFFVVLGFFLGLPLLFALLAIPVSIGSYNSFISLRQDAQTQWGEIETQMQRRADLVPQIVGATKGAMSQERAVFENISKAHAAFSNAPSGTSQKVQAGEALGTALRGYLVVAQQYPQLESLSLIRDLTTTIEGTENRITVARVRYNKDVGEYNKKISYFPGSFIANMFGFEKMDLFKMEDYAKNVPTVNLDFNVK